MFAYIACLEKATVQKAGIAYVGFGIFEGAKMKLEKDDKLAQGHRAFNSVTRVQIPVGAVSSIDCLFFDSI